MANQLTMALIDSIRTLHQQGWSNRRIARTLGIDRETVARYVGDADPPSKPANAPIGSHEEQSRSKPANAPIGSEHVDGEDSTTAPACRSGRASDCEPYRSIILDWLHQGLTAQRIYQDLVNEHGFAGSYYSVRRFVRKLEQPAELPFRRIETQPGEEAQVDFGTGAPIIDDKGTRRRTHVFRIVLSYSRKGYSEAVERQTTDCFLRCLENAFVHFGGVPQTLVIDNLRAAVARADWYDPDLQPKIRSFCAHYQTVILPTRPRMPRHKGKVERGIDYVQSNALARRSFTTLAEQNAHLRHWERHVADTRVHGTTRQQVGRLFAEVEQPVLQPLPPDRFPCFTEGQRQVGRDGYVKVQHAHYSVPPEYLRQRVWARWDGRIVRIFNQRLEQIAIHVQQPPGCFSTQHDHVPDRKRTLAERGTDWILLQIQHLGPRCRAWSEAVLTERGLEGTRVLQGLLALTRHYRAEQIDAACGSAHQHACYRLQTIRDLLKRRRHDEAPAALLQEHPLIRPMSAYALTIPFHQETDR